MYTGVFVLCFLVLVGLVDMKMSGAMFVLGVCQMSLFNWRSCSWNVSVLEVDTGLFWRVGWRVGVCLYIYIYIYMFTDSKAWIYGSDK